jgi:hypothetical protein
MMNRIRVVARDTLAMVKTLPEYAKGERFLAAQLFVSSRIHNRDERFVVVGDWRDLLRIGDKQ